MNRNRLLQINFLILILELYLFVIFLLRINHEESRSVYLMGLSLIFLWITINYMIGFIGSMYTSLIYIFALGSYGIYNSIFLGNQTTLFYYFILFIPPIIGITSGRFKTFITEVIDENKSLKNKNEDNILEDSITGLRNIVAMKKDLQKSMSFSDRHNIPIQLVLIEIKYIEELKSLYKSNDFEKIIEAISKCMISVTRKEDNKYRLSENMFAIILENITFDSGLCVKEKLKKELGEIEVKIGNVTEAINMDYYVVVYEYDSAIASVAEYLSKAKKELVYDV